MITEEKKAKIREEAKHIEKDALYSAKGHYEEANYWVRFHLLLGVPAAVLAAIAGASALAQFDNHALVAGFLSILVAALTGIATFLNPNEKSNAHQSVGTKYTALRNKTRQFYNLDMDVEESEKDLIEQLKALAKLRDELNEASPPISDWAYKIARRKIVNKQLQLQKDNAKNSSEKVLSLVPPQVTKRA